MSDGLRVARISTRPPGRSGYNWAIRPFRPPSSSLTKSSYVRVFQDDEVLAGRALEGGARCGER